MKHFETLTQKDINSMEMGEKFTYEMDNLLKRGMKVMPAMMIPIGLPIRSLKNDKR